MSQELESLLIKILGDATGIQTAAKKAEDAIKGFTKKSTADFMALGKKAQHLGKQMTRYITTPIVAGMTASVYAFANFDDAMAKSTAIMGDMSSRTRSQLEAVAIELSGNSVNSATDLAKAYFYLASAGMSAAESIAALPAVNTFAVAGSFDLSTATDLLTDAQSALGLNIGTTTEKMKEMVRISDVLVGANTIANASVEQFSNALTSKAAAAMKTYSKSLEEGVAVLTVMADQGTKGAEAGIQLDRLTRLMTGAHIANKEFHETKGFAVFDQMGEMRSYADIIENVTTATADMTPEVRSATIAMMGFDARIQGVLLPLLGTAGQMRINQQELERLAGITEDVAEAAMSSFGAQMTILWNQITNVSIGIGQRLAPAIAGVSSMLKGLMKWWNKTSDSFKNIAIAAAMITAAAGPLIFALGTLSIALALSSKLTAALAAHEITLNAAYIKTTLAATAKTVVMAGLNGVLKAAKFIANPYVLATAGVLALSYAIYKNIPSIKKWNFELDRRNKLSKQAEELKLNEFKKTDEDLLGMKEGSPEKIKELERLVIQAGKNAAGLRIGIKRTNKEADKLAPTFLSAWQAGSKLHEEQKAKAKDMEVALEAESLQREKLMKLLEQEKAIAKDNEVVGKNLKANVLAVEANALERLNTELKEQLATLGMTASQIQIYRARLKGASETAIHSLVTTQLVNDELEKELEIKKEAIEEDKRRAEAIENINKSLDDVIATMNMTSSEMAVYSAEQEGITGAELASLKVKTELVAKMQEEKKLMSDGKALTKSMRKPAEKLAEGQEKLKEMLELGAISVETYGRAMEKLEKDMRVKVSFKVTGIDAVEAGSLEAMARVNEFRALASKPNKVDFRKEGQEIVDAPKIAAEGEAIQAMWEEAAAQVAIAEEEAKKAETERKFMKNPLTPELKAQLKSMGMNVPEGMTGADLPGGTVAPEFRPGGAKHGQNPEYLYGGGGTEANLVKQQAARIESSSQRAAGNAGATIVEMQAMARDAAARAAAPPIGPDAANIVEMQAMGRDAAERIRQKELDASSIWGISEAEAEKKRFSPSSPAAPPKPETDSQPIKDTAKSNEIIADNTKKLVDAFSGFEGAGL